MTLSICIHTTLHHACFIEAPFGAYTSMVVHLFLCSIEFFSREATLGVSGNSDGCRWLSDPTSRVQIGEQQPQVETLRDCGVSKSHNLPAPWYIEVLDVRAPNGRGKKSKSKTARISRCFFLRTEYWHLDPKKKHWCVIMWWSCGDGFGLDGFGSALHEARKQPKVPKKATSDCPLHIATLPYRFADPWRFFFLSDISLHKNIQKPSPTFGQSGLWVFMLIFLLLPLRMVRWRFRWLGHCCLPKSWRLSGWWPRKLGGDPSVKRWMKEKNLKNHFFSDG